MAYSARSPHGAALRLSFMFSVALSACGGGGGAESAESAAARAGERLQGQWVLVDFRPEQPLEPVLSTLLAAQLGNLTITLDGQTLRAQGIGITAERTYAIREAEGDHFTADVVEAGHIAYEVRGRFAASELPFVSHTTPWRGTGKLIRAR